MSKSNFAPHADETVIAEGLAVKGSLDSPANIWFNGRIEGSINSAAELTIASSAQVEGNLSAANIVICGTVNGNVNAEGKLILQPGCKLTGDIKASTLTIAEGARFNGQVSMRAAPPPAKAA